MWGILVLRLGLGSVIEGELLGFGIMITVPEKFISNVNTN